MLPQRWVYNVTGMTPESCSTLWNKRTFRAVLEHLTYCMLILLFICHLLFLSRILHPFHFSSLWQTGKLLESFYTHIFRDLFYYSTTFYSVLYLIRPKYHKLKEVSGNRVRIYTRLCLTILHSYVSPEHSTHVRMRGVWFPQSPTQGRGALEGVKRKWAHCSQQPVPKQTADQTPKH